MGPYCEDPRKPPWRLWQGRESSTFHPSDLLSKETPERTSFRLGWRGECNGPTLGPGNPPVSPKGRKKAKKRL